MTEQLVLSKSPATVFRPIHYLGCKLRLLPLLEGLVDEVDPDRGRLLDLFSGTGVVAAQFAQRRSVVAADIQEYARVLASALLAPVSPSPHELREILDAASNHRHERRTLGLAALIAHERACLDRVEQAPDALCAIVEEGSLMRYAMEREVRSRELNEVLARAVQDASSGADMVLTRHYGGVYFSYEQALALDGLAYAVRRLPGPLRDVGLAAVLSTASEIVSSVGNQFAQPLRPRDRSGRPKSEPLQSIARRRCISARETFLSWLRRYAALPAPGSDGLALRSDFRDALRNPPAEIAVVYADPPYTRDHYSRYYHVLETIALGDDPGVSMMRLGKEMQVSRGLYRLERHQSPFSIKSQAPHAFAAMLKGARDLGAALVISYSPHGEGSASRPRLMGIDDIVELANVAYADVKIVPAGPLSHSKLNASRLNADPTYDAELFVVCRPA